MNEPSDSSMYRDLRLLKSAVFASYGFSLLAGIGIRIAFTEIPFVGTGLGISLASLCCLATTLRPVYEMRATRQVSADQKQELRDAMDDVADFRPSVWTVRLAVLFAYVFSFTGGYGIYVAFSEASPEVAIGLGLWLGSLCSIAVTMRSIPRPY